MIEPDIEAGRLPPQIRTAQLIVGALIAGVLIFAIVVGFTVSGQSTPSGGSAAQVSPDTLRIVWIAFFLSLIPFYTIFRVLMKKQLIAMEDAVWRKEFPRMFFLLTILGCAMFEGASLFACVIALITRHYVDLTYVLLPVGAMLLFFPTRGRFESYISMIQRERSFVGSGIARESTRE